MYLYCSESELGVLDHVLTVPLLNNGVDQVVEGDEASNLLLDFLGSGGVSVEVGSLTEEFSTETLSGVDDDSVLVVVSIGFPSVVGLLIVASATDNMSSFFPHGHVICITPFGHPNPSLYVYSIKASQSPVHTQVYF